ncbi:MAG TPA: NAD-dependent epimerase/dehydratase family protein, partial [Alphaproteobacteria bacterium]|nr:NAD-dependent epimerase/dehydratase family protein [Alphaproteobacteria bacterium]
MVSEELKISIDHSTPIREGTITGTRNLLELEKKNSSKFTFFSSSEIYGNPDNKNVPTSESYRGNVATSGPRACYD